MQATIIMSMIMGATGLLYLGLEIALLAAIVVSVRKHRPDAWGVLAMGVGMQMAGTLVSYVGSYAGSLMMAQAGGGGGVDGFMRVQSAVHLGAALISGTGKVMLILGIVRLAKPEQREFGVTY